jgi:hypothetical protein
MTGGAALTREQVSVRPGLSTQPTEGWIACNLSPLRMSVHLQQKPHSVPFVCRCLLEAIRSRFVHFTPEYPAEFSGYAICRFLGRRNDYSMSEPGKM